MMRDRDWSARNASASFGTMAMGVESSSQESMHQLPKHLELAFRSGHVNVTLRRHGPISARCKSNGFAPCTDRGRNANDRISENAQMLAQIDIVVFQRRGR